MISFLNIPSHVFQIRFAPEETNMSEDTVRRRSGRFRVCQLITDDFPRLGVIHAGKSRGGRHWSRSDSVAYVYGLVYGRLQP